MTAPTTPHAPYADPAAPAEMYDDCRATTAALRLPSATDRIAAAALRGAPSLLHADQRPSADKRPIGVDEATARLARAIFDD